MDGATVLPSASASASVATISSVVGVNGTQISATGTPTPSMQSFNGTSGAEGVRGLGTGVGASLVLAWGLGAGMLLL